MGKYKKGDSRWFTEARFGMFIHWGLYALPARGEWILKRELIPAEHYQVYFDLFNPDLFDPKAWAKATREAGMKYFVITAKHHEGFCLWDSKYTDYKVTNTPAGRDLLREVVDAFRAEGLRIGLYYSLIDWHHPDFTIDPVHPLWDHPDREKLNRGRDMKRYTEYMRNQVTELLTEYGEVDILWFDYSYPDRGKGRNEWESEKLIQLIRKLQPDVLIDNRIDLPEAGDITTPEQYTPDAPMRDKDGNPALWEGCQTFSGSWGYHRDETSWKTPKMCIEMLVNHVSRNGNLLMNVGPTARGYIDDRALNCLNGFAEWMRFNSRAIYGCGAAPEEYQAPLDCRYTWNPVTRRLYLHLFAWPFKHIHLPGLAGKVRYAQLLADGSEICFKKESKEVHYNCNISMIEGALTLLLPVSLPTGGEVPVIELIMN
ncbi:MAG: alpha-L-fucosidase [Kiritimatiellales bacterium]